MATTCPVCRKSDKIQKIAAIREAGISHGSYTGPSTGLAIIGGKVGVTGGVTNLSGTSITRLAEDFPPPPYPSPAKGSVGIVSILIGVGSLVLASIICTASNTSYDPGSGIGFAFFIAIAGLVASGFFAYGEKQKSQIADQKRFKADEKAWQKQQAIYDRIYYCSRDHICFDSKTRKHTTLANTWKLIFK